MRVTSKIPAVLLLSLLHFAATARGNVVIWDFEGVVTHDFYGGNVDLGDFVTGSFSFPDQGFGHITPVPIGASISANIDTDVFTITADATTPAIISKLRFYDGLFLNPGFEPDEFALVITNSDGSTNFQTQGFQNSDATIFGGDSHSQSLLPLSAWDGIPLIAYSDSAGSWQTTLTSLSKSAIPEPSSFALLCAIAAVVLGPSLARYARAWWAT